MIYQSTSVKNIIARVIINVNNNLPAMFLDDMLEWIPEAMEELETPYQLIKTSTPSKGCEGAICTQNYVAKLPCGLVSLEAVEDEHGCRVREGMDVTDITSPTTKVHSQAEDNAARSTDFQKDVRLTVGFDPATNVPGTQTPWDGSDIISADNPLQYAYYKIQMGCIQTSEESMFVKLHYYAIPTDDEGYPLIPDVTEYKEALYWYVMSKLITAGYKHATIPNNLQGIQYCNNEYEKHAGRALGVIRMPSQDKMARHRDGFAQRLIPPHHFYDDFGIGGEQVQNIQIV